MNAVRLMSILLQCSDQDSVTWPLTGLEEDWTMTLFNGSGTVSGSAVVHDKHWLWLFTPQTALVVTHRAHNTLCEEGQPESPPGMAVSSKYSTGSLAQKSLGKCLRTGVL